MDLISNRVRTGLRGEGERGAKRVCAAPIVPDPFQLYVEIAVRFECGVRDRWRSSFDSWIGDRHLCFTLRQSSIVVVAVVESSKQA